MTTQTAAMLRQLAAEREQSSAVEHTMALSNGWGTDSNAYQVSLMLEELAASPTSGESHEN